MLGDKKVLAVGILTSLDPKRLEKSAYEFHKCAVSRNKWGVGEKS